MLPGLESGLPNSVHAVRGALKFNEIVGYIGQENLIPSFQAFSRWLPPG